MGFQKTYTNIEFSSGHTAEDIRITMPDQLAYERACRANNWRTEDQVIANVFLSWHAAKREGHTDASFEEFKDGQCVDLYIERKEDQPADESDPTLPGATTA